MGLMKTSQRKEDTAKIYLSPRGRWKKQRMKEARISRLRELCSRSLVSHCPQVFKLVAGSDIPVFDGQTK